MRSGPLDQSANIGPPLDPLSDLLTHPWRDGSALHLYGVDALLHNLPAAMNLRRHVPSPSYPVIVEGPVIYAGLPGYNLELQQVALPWTPDECSPPMMKDPLCGEVHARLRQTLYIVSPSGSSYLLSFRLPLSGSDPGQTNGKVQRCFLAIAFLPSMSCRTGLRSRNSVCDPPLMEDRSFPNRPHSAAPPPTNGISTPYSGSSPLTITIAASHR